MAGSEKRRASQPPFTGRGAFGALPYIKIYLSLRLSFGEVNASSLVTQVTLNRHVHAPLPSVWAGGSNKEHALGERRRMALPGASVMSVARPTSVRHCAVTVKSMHGAFVLVVVGSQMCAVAHPGTHAPRGRRCCAGVTPGFQESCCPPVCSPSIVAFDFGFSDRSFSATLCEKDNPERKPPS